MAIPLSRPGIGWCFLYACAMAVSCAAQAQTPPASSAAPAAPPPAAAAKAEPPQRPQPAAIPLAEVPRRVAEASTTLDDMKSELASDRIAQTVEQELGALGFEIDARLGDTRRVIARTSSIETLRRVEARWIPMRRNLAEFSRRLARRLSQLDRDLAQLEELAQTWQKTLEDTKDSAPAEVQRSMQDLIKQIASMRDAATAQRGRVLTIQNRVAQQDDRIGDTLALAKKTRENLEQNIFDRDSPPIWSAELRADTSESTGARIHRSLARQWNTVQVYSERQGGRLPAQAAIFVVLAALLYWARRSVRAWLKDDPSFPDTGAIFNVPIATALLVSILGSFWLYPDAPILLLAALGALALVPAAFILRRLIDARLYPVLYALIAFYVADQLRLVLAAVQLLPRMLSLAEAAAAALFAIWIAVQSSRPSAPPDRHGFYLRWGGCIAFALCVVSLFTNMLGYVGLAGLVLNAVLGTAYVGLMLYALVEIVDGLFVMALHLPPLSRLGAVRRHRPLLRLRFRKFLQWLSLALLAVFALDRFALRERLWRVAQDVLTAEASVGSLRVSLGDVLAFVLCVWGAALVSRFVRFLLEEDVYTRLNLRRGTPYVISTMLNYSILVVGFFAGIAALGFDMTKFTILAGAFSIGVGFGLQNIFNNFVSGLILLFERPVKVGDAIQIGDEAAVVERIGIRASAVRTAAGSVILVPNGKLISEQVVNWTFSTRERSIQLPIAVPVATDLQRATQILVRVAQEHPQVAKQPPPTAIIFRLGPDWVGVELRAWIERVEQWADIRSDLALRCAAALAAEKISVR